MKAQKFYFKGAMMNCFKRNNFFLLSLCLFFVSGVSLVFCAECTVLVRLANHNRYVYESDEECEPTIHSVPWGNWGVSSNVGEKIDGHQFQGWKYSSGDGWWEWNSCTIFSVRGDFNDFNFPYGSMTYPLGYPFKDNFLHNNNVAPYGNDILVDQMSARTVSNEYGHVALLLSVPDPIDIDGDGTYDQGGCLWLKWYHVYNK